MKNKNILITGGNGFLGSVLFKKMVKAGYPKIATPSSRLVNLLDEKQTDGYISNDVEAIIHLAAVVGGIGANRNNPGKFFDENMRMGMNVLNSAVRHKVDKVLFVSTVCAYPHTPPNIPFREEDIWEGYPEPTNAPYGVAKKALMVMGESYKKQYGLNFVTATPTNLFGIGDSFDLENSHVIPVLIRKFQNALDNNEDTVILWGDGSPSREFLYVEDCADAIIKIFESKEIENLEHPFVNIGTGVETNIKDLANTIAKIIGYTGNIIWDTEKPNGQPRRCLDVSKLKNITGWESKVTLEKGLIETIKYWNNVKASYA